MIAYLDASAFLKLVMTEEGSDRATAAWEQATDPIASTAAIPESFAALAAARRANRISPGSFGEAKRRLVRLFSATLLIELTAGIARHAGELAEDHALRGYDAVHLATAVSIGREEVMLVSWDRNLLRAAGDLGLGVVGG